VVPPTSIATTPSVLMLRPAWQRQRRIVK